MNLHEMTDDQLKAEYRRLGGNPRRSGRDRLIELINDILATTLANDEKRSVMPNILEIGSPPPSSKEMGVGDEKDGTFNEVASLGKRTIPPIIQKHTKLGNDLLESMNEAVSWAKDEIILPVYEIETPVKLISVLPAEPSQALPQTLGMVIPVPVQRTHVGGLSQEQVLQATENHRQRGMTVRFFDDCWEFKRGERMDTGNMAMPLNAAVKAADLVCQASISAARVLKNGQQP